MMSEVAATAIREAMVDATVLAFGGLDLVHLNAGISSGHGLGADFDDLRWFALPACSLG